MCVCKKGLNCALSVVILGRTAHTHIRERATSRLRLIVEDPLNFFLFHPRAPFFHFHAHF